LGRILSQPESLPRWREGGQLRDLFAPFSERSRLREVLQVGEVFLADFEGRVVLANRLFSGQRRCTRLPNKRLQPQPLA
jgi:hypothetical protein